MSFEIVPPNGASTAPDLSDPEALRRAGNLTLGCGLVQEGAANGRLHGRAGRQVFVFEKHTGRLLHHLQSEDSPSWTDQFFNWLGGAEKRVLAVSQLAHRVCFRSRFHFSNLIIEQATVTLWVAATDAAGLAASLQQGGDPVFHLCETFKAQMGRQFNLIHLQDIHNLPQLRIRATEVVDRLAVNVAYLRVEGREIEIVPPKQVVQSYDAQLNHQLRMGEKRAEIAVNQHDLHAVGITDPHMLLLMSDPQTRPEVLRVLLETRLKQVQTESERDQARFSIKTQQVAEYIKVRVTDQTTPEELRGMLQMLDETSTPAPSAGKQFEVLNALPAPSSAPPVPPAPPAPPPRPASKVFQVVPPQAEPAPVPPAQERTARLQITEQPLQEEEDVL